jgi:Aspartyl protease
MLFSNCRFVLGRLAQVAIAGSGMLAIVLGTARIAQPAPYITLGPSDGFALDQPRVQIAVVDAQGHSLGPEFSNTFLLDTGSSSILAAAPAISELLDAGYQTVAQYDEQGIAGYTTMEVSQAYEVLVAGESGVPHAISAARILSNESLDVGFDGIMGVPAMMGLNTTMDMTVWSGANIDLLRTEFSDAPPASLGNRYSVGLTLVNFPQDGQHSPSDPLPTSAPLPLAPVVVRTPNHSVSSQFIVDTGAQISIISSATAQLLGIDPETDAIDELEVGGIGGSVVMPIVAVDSLALATQQGVQLGWTDLQVGVLDIAPGIDGIFGMDLLTSGWLDALFGGPDGFVSQVHFDFRDAANLQGAMLLDLNPSLNVLKYEGDVNGDGLIDIFDINLVSSNWGNAGGPGDANGDGIVNIFDINVVSADWGYFSAHQAAATAAPEPSGLALIALGIATIAAVAVVRGVRRKQN